jgi:hypothetical protein
MTTTLIAAFLVGIAAPVVCAFAWGVPFGLLSIGSVLRSFVGSGLTVLLLGTTAFFALRATSMPPKQIDAAAGLAGAAIGSLLWSSSAFRMRHVRGLSILCQRLQEEDARSMAFAALIQLLERIRGKSLQRHIALVLMATGPLTQAGMWSEARELLRSLDDDALSESQSVLRNQALATCELQFDDVDAARRAIERIPRPAPSGIEVWLVAIEALVMALRGESERALAHLGTVDGGSDNPSLRASHRLVHAHILAGRNDREGAIQELGMLRQEAGRAGLERVVRPRGPASPLAEQLLSEQSDIQSV